MKITALKQQIKNADRVSVFVDEKYSFSLSYDDILTYKVKKGIDATEADIVVYKKLSTDGKLRIRSYEWLMGRPHSTREFTDYLRKKQADEDIAAKLVQEFKDKGVLDDAYFADWFYEKSLRKNKSKRATQSELRGKGIDQVTIQSIASREDCMGGEAKALKQLIEKLRTRSRYSDQAKLIRYLLSKGFSYGDVKTALSLQEPEQEP